MTDLERFKYLMSEIYNTGVKVDFWVNENRDCLGMTLISGSDFRIHIDLNHFIVAEQLSEHANYIMKQTEHLVRGDEDDTSSESDS